MSENLGTLEAELVLSNKGMESGAKKSIATMSKLENSMNSLMVHGDKLTKSLNDTPAQSKNLKAISEAYKNQRRELKLVGEQQATFNDLIKAGVTSNEAYKIALGQESEHHKEIIKTINKERSAVNELKKSKQAAQNIKSAAQAKVQAKTEVDQNIQKNIAAMKIQQRVLGLTSKQQRYYNAMVKAGIPSTDAMRASTGRLSKAYQKEANTVKSLSDQTAKMNIKNTSSIAKNGKKQRKTLDSIGNSLGMLTNPYVLAAAGITTVAYASIKLGKAVTSVNATIENAGVKWEVLLGGMDDANNRMSELQNFAAKTPFKFEGISKASTILQSFGGDSLATGDSLTKLGDMSALAQRPIEELAMHYGRMYDAIQSGRPFGESALRMQELGLMSGKTSNQLNRMSKAGEDSNKMWKVFLDSTAHADGLMNKLSKTWDGLSSTLADNLKIIFQEGSKPLFDGMKIELENLLNYVIANKETITKWLNDWFNGTAKIVAITADLAGFLGDAVVAVAEFTNSDTQFEALDKKARMFASSIVEIDSMIRDATKSQEAYNKTGDSSFAKQIGLNISALKKQRSEQKSNLEQIKSQLKNIKNLGDAEEKLSEARAARRKRLEAEKKAMEEQATKLRLAAEANNKVSDSILKTIVGYDNKTRAMRLAGQEQLLFNDLLAAGIEGEKAFTIAVAGESDIHKKNIANLQKSIDAHESMKQTLDAANKAGEAKTAIDNGMKDTIKELTSDINNQKNALKATKQEQQQYNDLMKTGISSAAAWNLVNNKNTDGYVKQASAIKILSNELATLNNPKEKEATFNEKMIKFFDDMKKQSEDTALLVQGVFTSAFDNVGESMSDAIIDGKMEWDSMFKSIFSDITELIAKNLEMQAMSSVGSSMFGASSGSIIPHANGGVIGSPTYFPMGGSNTGLMGEAGPEAIMPLTRVGGKLGVETSGDSNGGNRTVNINVVTPTGNLSKQTLDQMSSEAHRFIRA